MNSKTKSLAFSGIMLVLAIIMLFFASFAPGIEMTLFALASFFVGFVILESGIKGGIVFYMALVLLSFLIIPNKIAILPFAAIFGLYGIVKYFIESIRKSPLEIILKLLFFSVVMTVVFYSFKSVFFGNNTLPDFPIYVLIIIADIFLLFYDYVYTLALAFYKSKIQKLKLF